MQMTSRVGLLVMVLAIVLSQRPAEGQGQAPDLAHYGWWRINLAMTMAATNQEFTRGDTFTWIFEPERDGIRFTVYETYPKPEPDRTFFARLDGVEIKQPHGPTRPDETAALWRPDRFVVFRMVRTKGKPTERSVYTIRPDGKQMVVVSINPDNPTRVGRMIFDRMEPPPGTATASR